MKNILLNSFAILGVSSLFAQVNVSTTPQNKVAVLEEYTGNNCTYCPEGHEIADAISNDLNAVTLKIQTGGFAGTDPIFGGNLKTPTGTAMAAPFDSQGYPNGTVSRKPGSIGVGRGSWTAAVQAVNAQVSPVNLYITSTVDVTTRELTVSVEYYYTSTEATGTNNISIGYYQDNIAAYQYDPGFYPSQFYMLEEEVYQFDHAFRDMMNGTWGEVISATTVGSTGIITKTITLPAAFSTFKVQPGAVKVFAFVSKSSQGEILNAIKSTPTYSNFPNNDEIGIVYMNKIKDEGCIGSQGSFSPKVLVNNFGGSNLTGCNAAYGVNGGSSSQAWTGNVGHDEKFVMTLSAATFNYAATNTADVVISLPNGSVDPTTTDNTKSSTFNVTEVTGNAQVIRIDAKADQYAAAESTWELYSDAGALLLSSGALVNSGVKSTYFTVPAGTDCYKFKLKDSYGDSWGSGSYLRVYDVSTGGAGTLMRNVGATDFGGSAIKIVKITSNGSTSVGIEDLVMEDVVVYPNPATDVLNVQFNAQSVDYTISVTDLQGRAVITETFNQLSGVQNIELSLNGLKAGNYIIGVNSTNGKSTRMFTIK